MKLGKQLKETNKQKKVSKQRGKKVLSIRRYFQFYQQLLLSF